MTPKRTSPAEDRAAYQWLTTTDLMREMQSSREKVIGTITGDPAFHAGDVIRYGREYRVRPEAWERYLASHAIETSDAA